MLNSMKTIMTVDIIGVTIFTFTDLMNKKTVKKTTIEQQQPQQQPADTIPDSAYPEHPLEMDCTGGKCMKTKPHDNNDDANTDTHTDTATTPFDVNKAAKIAQSLMANTNNNVDSAITSLVNELTCNTPNITPAPATPATPTTLTLTTTTA